MGAVTLSALRAMAGAELGVSGWVTIDQATIDAFADATGDRQFIHVDPAAAAATPMGGTVAHGFLLLALMPRLAEEADLPRAEGTLYIVNYGGERTRFVTPVRSGARVRARFTLEAMERKGRGRWQQTLGYTLEIEGEERPAVTASWLSLVMMDPTREDD